jgi:hypothetical protein
MYCALSKEMVLLSHFSKKEKKNLIILVSEICQRRALNNQQDINRY